MSVRMEDAKLPRKAEPSRTVRLPRTAEPSRTAGLLRMAGLLRTAGLLRKVRLPRKTEPQKNAGFSLIEMVIVVAILSVLGGMIFLNTGVSRRKETDRFSRELCNQIRLTRTVAMSKTGYWRLCLYLKDEDYYCVQERGVKNITASGTGEEIVWEAKSEPAFLGHDGAVSYTYSAEAGESGDPEGAKPEAAAGEDSGKLICAWRFDRNTGACIKGAGTLEVIGSGKTRTVTVYRENGYCEEK